MASSRLPDRPATARRLPLAGADPPVRRPRDLLLHTWPGRLFIISAGLKIVVALIRLAVDLPRFIQIVSSAATLGLVVSVAYFAWELFVLTKRRLLWRVRRKLILSYIFIGVVPSLLIVIFFLLGGVLIFMNVSAYLFKDGYDSMVDYVKVATESAASEIARTPESAEASLTRIHRNASRLYPVLSLAYVASSPAVDKRGRVEADTRLTALRASMVLGPWEHAPPPAKIPEWLTRRPFPGGTIVVPSPEDAGQVQLVIRSAIPVVVNGGTLGFVIGDLPIGADMIQRLEEVTRVHAGAASTIAETAATEQRSIGGTGDDASGGRLTTLFGKSLMFLDYQDWETGAEGQVGLSLSYRPMQLYRQLSDAQQIVFRGQSLGEWAVVILLVIAVLFLTIEAVALGMGLALARSITSSIHELFMGTERVRHGDFAHRIDVASNDQLGELAGSFNQMTGSIEGLLQTAAEKKRLEEELRIARVIQMSLLPTGPLDVPGLAITALCVPAREVGGDYYDFFRLAGGRLGVLIADVSGKGTSAALYMAELKGLVLALSQRYDSPRELLIEVNRIISEHLDSRSFITMTYAVIDIDRGLMTFCRAGHTPLIFLSSVPATTPLAQVLTPNGMVLGLRIDGASEMFAELLEEQCVDLSAGDVVVLYTDGITEAMNLESDLFGDSRLSRLVEEHGHLESGELRERILREIEAFVGTADQHDDMTMILLKVDRAFAAASQVAV
ncbi:MAG: SpoIIE family protein phosphatase [Acidobacteriota bacterium]|nr:SpoIIE family protein phosphatase [Acidobacteriota bacterium]